MRNPAPMETVRGGKGTARGGRSDANTQALRGRRDGRVGPARECELPNGHTTPRSSSERGWDSHESLLSAAARTCVRQDGQQVPAQLRGRRGSRRDIKQDPLRRILRARAARRFAAAGRVGDGSGKVKRGSKGHLCGGGVRRIQIGSRCLESMVKIAQRFYDRHCGDCCARGRELRSCVAPARPAAAM